jgi:hypothetical protein
LLLTVLRNPSENGATVSEMLLDGVPECFVLEDEIREVEGVPVSQWKVKGASAIPAGKYRVVLTMSNRVKKVLPELLEVPGFSGVRIHAGNDKDDTEGCLLVGQERGSETVTRSRDAMVELMAALTGVVEQGESVWIEIVNPA